MRTKFPLLCALAFVACGPLTPSTAPAQEEPILYPTKGQGPEQQEKDKYECYSWAKKQTGFDPMQGGQTAAAPEEPSTARGALRGGARGALVGTAVGAIAGDAGKGAAIGAAGGGLIGGMRSRDAARAQQDAAQQEASRSAEGKNQYNRAFGACMEGRGYTVR